MKEQQYEKSNWKKFEYSHREQAHPHCKEGRNHMIKKEKKSFIFPPHQHEHGIMPFYCC